MSSLMRSFANFTAHSKPTVGDLKMSAITADHLGWLNCDGRELSISEWRFLFNAIGYQFGVGVAPNTFKLPNPAGTVPGTVGQGTQVGNTTLRELGDFDGKETHTLIINEIPSHRHGAADVSGNNDGSATTSINGAHNHTGSTGNAGSHTHTATDSGHTHGGVPNQASTAINGASNNTGNGGSTGDGFANITVAGVGDHAHSIATDGDHTHTAALTGGSAAHNNMQPTLFIGSTFIYSGKPTFGTWPLTYPPPSYGYGGQPQIL
jgi:microcystin-dependent protein